MRIDNQDIIRAAREQRNEENRRLHIRPWGHRSHFRVPAWLTAVPAAAIAGFFLGLWTNSRPLADVPQTVMVDTVYIKVKDVTSTVDTVHAKTYSQPEPPACRTNKTKAGKQSRMSKTGRSMMNDQIRYDLLVKN